MTGDMRTHGRPSGISPEAHRRITAQFTRLRRIIALEMRRLGSAEGPPFRADASLLDEEKLPGLVVLQGANLASGRDFQQVPQPPQRPGAICEGSHFVVASGNWSGPPNAEEARPTSPSTMQLRFEPVDFVNSLGRTQQERCGNWRARTSAGLLASRKIPASPATRRGRGRFSWRAVSASLECATRAHQAS